MDPNATLAELLDVARKYEEGIPDTSDQGTVYDDLEQMSELVLALDEWIKKGGFLPARWERK